MAFKRSCREVMFSLASVCPHHVSHGVGHMVVYPLFFPMNIRPGTYPLPRTTDLGTYHLSLLLTSGGHHWRPVHLTTYPATPITGTDSGQADLLKCSLVIKLSIPFLLHTQLPGWSTLWQARHQSSEGWSSPVGFFSFWTMYSVHSGMYLCRNQTEVGDSHLGLQCSAGFLRELEFHSKIDKRVFDVRMVDRFRWDHWLTIFRVKDFKSYNIF